MLIGIDCPTVNFFPKKLDSLESKQENDWQFKIVLNDPNVKTIKIKYMVRFFYDQNLTTDDYRNSKEGI